MAMEYDYTIDYNERMLNYYPEVIKAIKEFQTLITTQSLQVQEMHDELTRILGDAYINTASEERVNEWEKFLGITPLPQDDDTLEQWLQDRKETILARLYSTPKLNTQSIADIVSIFTGGTAESYFKNGIIHIFITPPKNNKQFKFENVETELSKKIPAHLSFKVSRRYYTWGELNNKFTTWGDLKTAHATWEDLLLQVPSN